MKPFRGMCRFVGLAIGAFLSFMQILVAQEATVGGQPSVAPTRLMLTPMKLPQPAMKYELLPKAIDRLPGNAAVHYGKVKSEQNYFFSSKEVAKTIELAQARPLNELKDNKEFDVLLNLGAIYSSLKRGARCEQADWQLPIREEFFGNILLPEIQESRSFARLLQGRARVQMARGDFEESIDSIQTGMSLARHVARGETLINGLVGKAIAGIMLESIQELIAQPGAPNLYWALSTLPSPLIDLRPGFEAEQYILYWTESKWRHPELMQGDEDFWRGELERLWGYVSGLSEDPQIKGSLATRVVRGYQSAKKRLLHRGFEPDEVENMPVAKAVMMDVLHQYNCNRDAQFAAVQQALLDPTRVSQLAVVESQKYEECLPISSAMGVGTYSSIINAIVLTGRNVAILQVIEAIRMHAAETGKFPARLNDITAVIVPNDPSTNQPFVYELNKDVAVIASSTLKQPIRLELKLN